MLLTQTWTEWKKTLQNKMLYTLQIFFGISQKDSWTSEVWTHYATDGRNPEPLLPFQVFNILHYFCAETSRVRYYRNNECLCKKMEYFLMLLLQIEDLVLLSADTHTRKQLTWTSKWLEDRSCSFGGSLHVSTSISKPGMRVPVNTRLTN